MANPTAETARRCRHCWDPLPDGLRGRDRLEAMLCRESPSGVHEPG